MINSEEVFQQQIPVPEEVDATQPNTSETGTITNQTLLEADAIIESITYNQE